MNISKQQLEILRHVASRAACGYYCGGGKDMDVLVGLGLMKSAGYKSFVPDEYFIITTEGRKVLQEHSL